MRHMMVRLTLIRYTLGAVITAAALTLSGCAEKQAAKKAGAPGSRAGDRKQAVEVLPLARTDMTETLTVVGSLAPNESADIRAEVAGLVRAIHFEEGMPVKAGQVIVKIDDSELMAQLAQSEARYQLAELNRQRAENLRQTQSNTQADFDRARSEFASAKAELALLKLRIEKTEIKAPFDGIVGSRTISVGDYVSTQTSITKIDDLSRLKIEFKVPERFLSKIHPGTLFTVLSSELSADPNAAPVQGEVYFVNSVIDRATRSSEVKGLLKNPPPKLKPGMFANVEVVLDVRRGVFTVPEGSILTTAEGSSLVVVRNAPKDPTADFVRVRLGLRAQGQVEVEGIDGKLEESQPIVASGVGGLILFKGAKLDLRPLKERFRPKS